MNLGNTCYANSVIQVLHKIPELEEGVKSVADVDSGRGTPGALASELKKTFDQMDHSLSAVKPISLVNVLLLECDKE
jgi:singapore isolate B (sub-type 7) whole genome shotgun sequence assembly, scaffold_11